MYRYVILDMFCQFIIMLEIHKSELGNLIVIFMQIVVEVTLQVYACLKCHDMLLLLQKHQTLTASAADDDAAAAAAVCGEESSAGKCLLVLFY